MYQAGKNTSEKYPTLSISSKKVFNIGTWRHPVIERSG